METIDIRVATEEDFSAMAVFDGIAFGSPWPEKLLESAKATLDFDRFRVAHDGDTLVGVAGSYAQEVTVPGGAQVRSGGVTWVAVAPTHRRQGLLTRLMGELHDDIDARNEPIAMLTASEGGIYERFGYGIASYIRVIEIDRRRVQVMPEFGPPPGSVRMSTLDDPELPRIYDRYRRARVGEIDRTPEADEMFRTEQGDGVAVAIHADGFATWKVKANWNAGHPAHELTLSDVVAITPEAHASLWHTILSVDLVGPITGFRSVALDDALPYIVTDQRAIRTTNVNDMLWLNIRDVGAALRARTYGTDDELVVEVDLVDRVERWRVAGGPTSGEAKQVRSRPVLVMNRAALGAIYLGGVRPSTLAKVGSITGKPDVIRRADAFFVADRLPHCTTGF